MDAAAAMLVRDPARFDVLLTTNMFGDILSNEAAELCGVPGLAPSLNAGARTAMAQAAHGSAPDIAGRGIADPTGLTLSVAMLLDWLGRTRNTRACRDAARHIDAAVRAALAHPDTRPCKVEAAMTHRLSRIDRLLPAKLKRGRGRGGHRRRRKVPHPDEWRGEGTTMRVPCGQGRDRRTDVPLS